MKKVYVLIIIAAILFIVAFADKIRDEEKIIENRKYSAGPLEDGMLLVHTSEMEFLIDQYEYPNRSGDMPEGGMKFEDAREACAKAGKRLCTEREWFEACSGEQLRRYSYGEKFDGEICNSLHHQKRLAPSGSFEDCRTGSDLYDMAGNLWEWVQPADTGALQAKGGSYRDGELAQRCAHTFKLFPVQEPHLVFDNFGTRCCMDAGAGD